MRPARGAQQVLGLAATPEVNVRNGRIRNFETLLHSGGAIIGDIHRPETESLRSVTAQTMLRKRDPSL